MHRLPLTQLNDKHYCIHKAIQSTYFLLLQKEIYVKICTEDVPRKMGTERIRLILLSYNLSIVNIY